MNITLDPWQQKVLETKGDICLRSGRQVGKSTIISIKAAEYAIKNSKKTVLVIASVERQAYLLFEKILAYLHDNHRKEIKKGRDKPTKHKISLSNGSVIYSLPTGLAGFGIRGYTVDLLIADEAHFIPEEVWTAVTPMTAARKGIVWLLSTPHGKGGWYEDCFSNPNFTTFHVSSEDCPRINKAWLKREKERMTKVQYAQEYLGEFVDELLQFFPTELIKKCLTLKRPKEKPTKGDNFLGVDVAGMGEDETVLLSLNRSINKKWLNQIDMQVTTKKRTTQTIKSIKGHDIRFNYKKIYIDDGGMGVGVFDALLEEYPTKRKVVAINNARRSIEYDAEGKGRRKRLMKEDLYNNLLKLMESGEIKLFKEPEIMQSLKSIQYETAEDKSIKIFGKYSHITEALIRAAWCMKDKSLNIYLY